MEIDVQVGISARHVHLKEETYYKLFDKPLTKKNDLNQLGQFAANETVKIRTSQNVFENVRIIGPLREYDQIEISKSDARILGINPPVRKSGDVLNSEKVILETAKDSVEIEGCIIADRHVHMNEKKALELGLYDNEIIKLKIEGEKSGIIDAFVKISENGFFEVHLDTDDANANLLQNNDLVKIVL
ncbi:MAG: propanediol utilization protein [Firmicutes bacterium]|nr:propanediol utilization protein [Bacillota bacterium]